ncbi:histidine phosphatase family protein [Deinococcus deserti]|uniref:Putative phosphoglycerate mutase family n=1 Tax=Deinococcus deserti (strain DSM 17065 / CIP 109153 / LMG 22923 / VCD115) TaxID=546414 RepID=C1D461_DEIDV|nr:histidine phosphatase family protein [Deinococcus deserti]ACO47942.1 putative phosphoglycerate mutase family, precursor [Deinococcus deserti VCD115]
MTRKRETLTRWLITLGLCALSTAKAQSQWNALTDGAVVLFRHALAPGTGDPPGFRLNDCRTQRNLNAEGRAQARRIGRAFRERRVTVTRVLSSRWCRARETASLAFPGKVHNEAAFNSFFDNSAQEPAQTRAARGVLARWKGPGVLVVVTHQVNITALTGIVPASGEGIIVRFQDDRLKVLGRVTP